MVAIISSNGLGVSNNGLGQRGVFGSGSNGRNGEQASVNIATGNLILQDRDDLLVTGGQDIASIRTYNSQGVANDHNGDNWLNGFYRQQIRLVSGTLNQSGSSLVRTAFDGAQQVFTFTGSQYQSNDGAGSYDTIRIDSQTGHFLHQEANSRVTSEYDASGRLLSSRDTAGNTLNYRYGDNGLLSSISDDLGETTFYDYNASNQLTQIRSQSSQNGVTSNLTRVHYHYDYLSRLDQVTVDLTPQDGHIDDASSNSADDNNRKVYITHYSYYNASQLISSITQSDGSSLAITYDAQNRVQTVTDALNYTTRFDYDSTGRTTRVTDPLQLVTQYQYNSQGQLTQVFEPGVGEGQQSIQYEYDAAGNLKTVTGQDGRVEHYTYDASGNVTSQSDGAGDTLTRTFDANNQLLSETRYQSAASGSVAASGPQTTRYVQDAQSHLRFVISPEGRVTEYRYNAKGQRVASLYYQRNSSTPPTASVPTEAQLVIWAAAQDSKNIERTDYQYDGLGQLKKSLQYAILTTQGEGIVDGNTGTTQYVYDQAGQLLQTINPNGGSIAYTYDGLGRQISSSTADSGARHETTLTNYDDHGQKIVVQQANSLSRIAVYDLANRLIAEREQDLAGHILGQTTWIYDADDRLRQQTDPSGISQWFTYDDAGRRNASINPDGEVTEYHYNNANQVVRTIVRETALGSAQLAALHTDPTLVSGPDGSVVAGNASVSVAPSAADRISRSLYDTAGQLIKTIDAQGYVLTQRYDGAGRLVSSTASASPLNPGQLAYLADLEDQGLTLDARDANTVAALDTQNDRTTRRFYDNDGLLLGVLDADGYLTEYQYQGDGQLSQTLRYAKASANPSGGTLAQVRPATDPANDQRSLTLYNQKGQVAAVIDAENYLTRYQYDNAGNPTQVQRFATQLASPPAATIRLDDPLLQLATSASDHITRTSYDTLNRLISSTNAEGTVTSYSYDLAGNLIAAVQAQVSVAEGGVRGNDRQYDLQGRLIAELTGEASHQLHAGNLNQTQIDTLWRQNANHHTYDAAGRKTSSTDPNGNSTLYYYDSTGRPTLTINALGEVTRQGYDLHGELASLTQYSTRIDASQLANLQRTTLTAGLARATPVILADALADSVELRSYDTRGQLASQTRPTGGTYSDGNPAGSSTSYNYNAFGEISQETTRIADPVTRVITGRSGGVGLGLPDTSAPNLFTITQYSYTRRGQLAQTVRDAGLLNQTTGQSVDAFGRVISRFDANRNTTLTSYDRLGRVVQIKDPLQPASLLTYDAFDQVLTRTDGLGNLTRYDYDLANRSLTVTTPEQVKITTVHNRYGEQARVTDGLGNITTYNYNGDGQLIKTSDSIGNRSNTYDRAGLLLTSTDGRGIVTETHYDAANRVLVRTIDPNRTGYTGLNLATQYSYDAKGQTLTVTDPRGIVTETGYDLLGQVKTITVDKGGLNLVTTFAYDPRGNTLTVTNPNNQITQYGYDALGRRTSQTVDTAGLKLKTTYGYDANDNLLTVTDPNGKLTRNLYDAQNRISDTIDAAGGVTHNEYDAAGRIITQTAYANAINPALLSNNSTAANLASLLRPDAARDNVLHTVYNKDGQVRFTVNANRDVQEYKYDQNGNQWRSIVWKGIDASYITAYTDAGLSQAVRGYTAAEVSRNTKLFDARNRVAYEYDYYGATTQYQYDANDNLIQRIDYVVGAYASNLPDHPTITAFQTELARFQSSSGGFNYKTDNRNQLFQYDAANRQITHATLFAPSRGTDAPIHWLIETRQYDGAGNLIASSAFDHNGESQSDSNSLTGISILTEAQTASALTAWRNGTRNFAQERNSRYAYDGASRLLASATAQGLSDDQSSLRWAVLANRYDNVGNVLARTAYASAIRSGANSDIGQGELGAFLQSPPANAAQDHTERYYYDNANRQIFAINAVGSVTQNQYDAVGNLTQQVQYAASVTSGALDINALQTALTPAGQSWANRANWLADGKNRINASVYDAANRAIIQIDALGNVREQQYDALGNVTRIKTYGNPVGPALAAGKPTYASVITALGSNPAARTELRLFDAVSNLRYQIDAAGYVSETRYDSFSRVAGTFRHPTPQTDPAVTGNITLLQQRLGIYGGRLGNLFSYDYSGNLNQGSTLEQGSFYYQFTNLHTRYYGNDGRLNTSFYETDTAGHVVRQSNYSPLDGSNNVNNPRAVLTYSYDVFGNLLARTESSGTGILGNYTIIGHSLLTETDLHTTEYRYDAVGRQIQTILPELQIYDAAQDTPDLSNPNAVKTVAATSTTFYDNLGNAIANQDAAGNYRYKTYDVQGRTTFEIDQLGYVTGYEYDSFGELTRTTRYATPLNVNPAVRSDFTTDSVKAALSVQNAQDRSIQTRYDLLGRVTRTIEPQALLYDKVQRTSGSDYTSAAKTTDTFYNGYGEAYKTSEYGIDASGNVVTSVNTRYTVRDSRGQTIAELSLIAASSSEETGYLTSYVYDVWGNITQQTEYANAIKAAPVTFSEAARLGTGFATPTSNIDDRVTINEYDGSHRKTKETRKNVLVASAADLSANAVNTRADIVTTYGYDNTGNLIWTGDSLGRYTVSSYNQQGYVIAVLSNAPNVNQSAPLTVFKRDAHGNIVQRIDYANGGKFSFYGQGVIITPNPADKDHDRITKYSYDKQNHLIQTTDALDNVSNAAYDVLGHLAKQSQLLTNVGFASSEQVAHVYQYDAAGHQSDDISRDARDALNTGAANLVRLHSDYNGFGELTRKSRYASDLAGAVYETNQYDNAGHLFKTNAGDGVEKLQLFDLDGRQTASIRTTSGNVHDITGEDGLIYLDRNAAIITETRYDLAGRAISQITDSSHLSNSSTINQIVDRWGNVIARSDPRNAVTGKNWRTLYRYNANNQQVASTLYGDSDTILTSSQSAYDAAGREIASIDGNQNLNRKVYDSFDNLAQEKHADGGTVSHSYDLLGNRISTLVAQDASHSLRTRFAYDKKGQLLETRTDAVEVYLARPGANAQQLPPGSNTVLRLYALLLGTAPTRTTLDAQSAQIGPDGADITLADSIIRANPGKYPANLNERDFIVTLYLTGLGRTPAATEIDGWVETLARANHDRPRIARDFSGVADQDNSDSDNFNYLVDRLKSTYDLGVPANNGAVNLYDQGSKELVESYRYDQLGRKVLVSNSTGETSLTRYNQNGDVIATRDAAGHDDKSSYDNAHHKVSEVDGSGHTRSWTYDAQTGQLANSTDLGDVTTTYTYDKAGHLMNQTSSGGQNLGYGYRGDLLTDIEDTALHQHTSYDYDRAGNRILESNSRGLEQLQNNHIVFDAANRITHLEDGRFTINYLYDQNGNRTSTYTKYTDNANQAHEQTRFNQYDRQNRAIVTGSTSDGVVTFDDQTHQIAYDWAGNRTSDTYKGTYIVAPGGGPSGSATTTETYAYDAAGRLSTTTRDGWLTVNLRKYDAAGRIVRSGAVGFVDTINPPEGRDGRDLSDFFRLAGVNTEYTLNVYYHGQLYRQKNLELNENTGTADHDGQGGNGNDTYFFDGVGTGYDGAGNVLGYTVVDPSGHRTAYQIDYRRGNGYQEKKVTAIQQNGTTGTTISTYDVNGNRTGLIDATTTGIGSGASTLTTDTRSFDFDAQGRILRKIDIDRENNVKTTHSLIAGGELLGTDEAKAAGELANPYQSVNSTALTNAPGYYSVREHDTFQSIARNVWGDAKLWYVISDANPSAVNTAAGELRAGDLLRLPARPNTINNDSNTFTPYDPARLTGATSPNLPSPADGNCGAVGRIISVVVAVVVSTYLGPVIGNIAGQIAGNLTGTQEGLDFKSVALSAVSYGVGQYLAPGAAALGGTSGAVAHAAITSAITQGIGVATGLQKSFSFRSVVASGIGAGVGAAVGSALGVDSNAAPTFNPADFGKRLLTSLAAGGATAIARGGRVSVVQVGANAFGQTLGSALAAQTTNRPERPERALTEGPLTLQTRLESQQQVTNALPGNALPEEFIDNYSNKAQGFGENPNAPTQTLLSRLVQKGDTLSKLADNNLAQVGLIAERNDLRSSNIRVGQGLLIPDISDFSPQDQVNYAVRGARIYAQDNAAALARRVTEQASRANNAFVFDLGTSADDAIRNNILFGTPSIPLPAPQQQDTRTFAPVLQQVRTANDFAYQPQGTKITATQVKLQLQQLIDAASNPSLSFTERNYVASAYANVYTRGNVEGVLNAEITPGYAAYALDASIATGGTAIKGTIALVPTQSTVLPQTTSKFVPIPTLLNQPSSDPGLDSFIFSLTARGVNVVNKNLAIHGPDGKDLGEFDVITDKVIIQYKDGSSGAKAVIDQVRVNSEPFTDRPVYVFVNATDKAGLRTVKGATGKIQIYNNRDAISNKVK